MIIDGRASKCRVRTAHADFQRRMKRVRSAHPTTVCTQGKARFNFFTDMLVKAAFMRLSGHASPGAKRHAAPGDAKKWKSKINYADLLIRRRNKRNRVAFIASIDAKIGTIYSDDAVLRKKLTHSNQAEIGEVGMAVTVALRECGQLRQMIVAVECQADEPLLKQRDQKSGICNTFQVREKPLQRERRFGPFTLPARRINPWPAAAVRAFSSRSRTNLPFDTPDLATVSSSQIASSSLTQTEIV